MARRLPLEWQIRGFVGVVVGGLLALLRERLIGIPLLVEVLPSRLCQHFPQAGLSGQSGLRPIVIIIVLIHDVVVHVVNVELLVGVKVQILVLGGYVPLIEILCQGGNLFR